MDYHVLTLFPEMIEQTVNTSITGRAVKSGKISLHMVNIRDYAQNKYGRVDDYPYGGGAGLPGLSGCDQPIPGGENRKKAQMYLSDAPGTSAEPGVGGGAGSGGGIIFSLRTLRGH